MHFKKEEHLLTLTVQSDNLKNQKRSVYNEIFLHHKETKTTWPTRTARDCLYAVTRDVSANRARSVQTISKKTRVATLLVPQVAPFPPLSLHLHTLSSYLRLDLSSDIFPSGFPSVILYTMHFLFLMQTTFPAHLISLFWWHWWYMMKRINYEVLY
jgi:hypothetical protein